MEMHEKMNKLFFYSVLLIFLKVQLHIHKRFIEIIWLDRDSTLCIQPLWFMAIDDTYVQLLFFKYSIINAFSNIFILPGQSSAHYLGY